MKISITAREVLDDRYGRLKQGAVVDMPNAKALFYLKRGEAEMYDTKVVRERPLPVAGQPLSASPAAQVSPQTTAQPSVSGEDYKPRKRRGRPPLSSSTPHSD